MTKPRLHDLHVEPRCDKQRREVVAQVVEPEAFWESNLRYGRSHGALDRPRPSWVAPLVADEVAAVTERHRRGQQPSHVQRNRDRPAAQLGLQRLVAPLHRWRHHAGFEVDVGDPQRSGLCQTQPGVRAKQDCGLHPGGHGVVERPHLRGGGDVRPLLTHARRRTPRTRIPRDQLIVDSI